MALKLANRVPETSAELLRMIVAGLGCLDTADAGSLDGAQTGINIVGEWTLGVDAWTATEVGGAHDYPSGAWKQGTPDGILGTPDPDAYIFGLTPDAGIYDSTIRHDFPVTIDTYATGFQAGCAFTFPSIAVLSAEILLFDWPELLKKLPQDAEILDAWIPVSWDSSFQLFRAKYYRKYNYSVGSFGLSAWTDADPVPAPGEDETELVTGDVEMGWSLIGLKANGDWAPLGSWIDSGGSGATAGKTRIIHAKTLVEKLIQYRGDGTYVQFGIYPSTISGGDVSELPPSGSLDKAIALNIMSGYSKVTSHGDNGVDPTGLDYQKYVELDATMLQCDARPSYGALTIQFKLPDDMIEDVQPMFGNLPTFTPKS